MIDRISVPPGAREPWSGPSREVHGLLRSRVEYIGERIYGGAADMLHCLLFRAGVLTQVPKWRPVQPARAILPLPRASDEVALAQGGAWRVAPGFGFQAVGAAPQGRATASPADASEGVGEGPAFWVTDPRTGLRAAYRVDVGQAEALAGLVAGAQVGALEPGLRAALAQAGALRPADGALAPGVGAQGSPRSAEAADEAPWTAEHERLAAEFAAEGFVVIPALLGPALLMAVQAYYRELPAQRRLEADLFSGRLVEKNEAYARHLLADLTGFVGALAVRPVRPSYCFSMWYSAGARLRVHRDNALCEYTLNLVIDQDGGQAADWPLCLRRRGGRVEALHLHPGDAVLFRGRELAHWRGRLRGPARAIGVLLHYVDGDFSGDMQAAGLYD